MPAHSLEQRTTTLDQSCRHRRPNARTWMERAPRRTARLPLSTAGATLLVVTASSIWASAALAQLPAGFSRVPILTGLSATSLTFAPDGRLFITTQKGQIRIFKKGTLLTQPYAKLEPSTEMERGLVGLAFDPDYGGTNCSVYVYYTTGPNSLNYSGTPTPRLSRLEGCGDVADPGETVLRDFPSSTLSFHHNGGNIQFGPDGKLYVGIGDGGKSINGQKLDTFRGKMLRLNRNGTAPSDNPFVGVPGALPEIWAYGLRNPWRYTFRPKNGSFIIADVGARHWEEIDVGVAGGNYAWGKYEGPCLRESGTGEADCTPDPTTYPAEFEYPILFYFHDPLPAPTSPARVDPDQDDPGPIAADGDPDHVGESTRAIIGGVFATGNNYPTEIRGRYFYGDFVAHFIRTVRLDGTNQVKRDDPFDTLEHGPTCFARGPDGNIYVAEWNSGTVHKYVYTAPPSP